MVKLQIDANPNYLVESVSACRLPLQRNDAQLGRGAALRRKHVCWRPANRSSGMHQLHQIARGAETKANDRVFDLVSKLLSPKVQVQESATIADVPCKLHPREVAKIFIDNVPGVKGFLFRQQPEKFCLEFLQSAYHSGFTAFRNTPVHDHLLRLFRLIVHHGLENGPGASTYLREVAEAFMDCQAVQARVVERVGLQIQGVSSNFRGLLVALIGEYKTVAIKMLAAERISQLQVSDDGNPVHYENRLIADIGPALGLDASDIRRARLDEHARSPFQCLNHVEQEKA